MLFDSLPALIEVDGSELHLVTPVEAEVVTEGVAIGRVKEHARGGLRVGLVGVVREVSVQLIEMPRPEAFRAVLVFCQSVGVVFTIKDEFVIWPLDDDICLHDGEQRLTFRGE